MYYGGRLYTLADNGFMFILADFEPFRGAHIGSRVIEHGGVLLVQGVRRCREIGENSFRNNLKNLVRVSIPRIQGGTDIPVVQQK